MNKAGAIVMIVGGVILLYVLLLVIMPVFVDITLTANTTMDTTSNMTNYPGTAGAVVSAPWALFFVPGAIGIILIISVLRRP